MLRQGSVKRGQLAGGFIDAGQGQVRRVGFVLRFDAQSYAGLVGAGGEVREGFATFYSCPENPRAFGVGEEAEATNGDPESTATLEKGQRRRHFVQTILRPCADKLGGDVKIGGRAPANGSERFEAPHE